MIIEVFYRGRNYRTNAKGEFDIDTGAVTIFKGSVVSESVAQFAGAEKIRDLRKQNTNDEGVLLQDLKFDSPSSAASFVSGYSANGLITWHVEKHKTLKTYLQEME